MNTGQSEEINEAAYVYALARIQGLGDTLIARVLLKYGSARQVAALEFDSESSWEHRIKKLINASPVSEYVEEGYAVVQAAEGLGGNVLSILSDEYPLSLSQLPSPPPILFILGQISESDNYAVAVVGTRKPTARGAKDAFRLASDLGRSGITVISGMARGIDTSAHKGAISVGGRTLAVIGTGFDVVYPSENKDLADEIVSSGGALISQYPPGTAPRRWHFPMRNRLMSGLAQGTVVVEASERSGAKLQAQYAAEQGRILFLMQQQVARYEWARKLAEDGSGLVVNSVDDVISQLCTLDELGFVPPVIKVIRQLL